MTIVADQSVARPVSTGRARFVSEVSARRQAIGSALLLALLLGVIGVVADRGYRQHLVDLKRIDYAQQLAPFGNTLATAVNSPLSVLSGLKAFTEFAYDTRTFYRDFDVYAGALYEVTPNIRTMQFAQEGVVQHAFPLEGNEGAIGYDLLADPRPSVSADVRRAIATKNLVISGPLELEPGGLALVARLAAFTPARPQDRLLGLVSIVLDVQPLLRRTGIFDDARFRVAIRDSSGVVFAGDPGIFAEEPVLAIVPLVDGRWEIGALPAAGWEGAIAPDVRIARALFLTLIALVVALSYVLVNRQASLAFAVRERTSSLEKALDELKRETQSRRRIELRLQTAEKLEGLGRLAGGVAHDFNNLLTSMIGSLALARSELAPGDPALEEIEEAEQDARRAADLTKQLLAFARRQQVTPRVLHVDRVLRGLRGLLGRLTGDKVELIIDLDESLWPIYIDGTQLEQVVTNLAVNARDAMPEGGRLVLRARNILIEQADSDAVGEWLAPGPYVQLLVTDTGEGMSSETATRIFEPFFTTKPQGKGTGLGLATCYGIVRQAGGMIRVESVIGQGTTFLVTLPRAPEGEQVTA